MSILKPTAAEKKRAKKAMEQYREYVKKVEKKKAAELRAKLKQMPLPKSITMADLKNPSYRSSYSCDKLGEANRISDRFELWYTSGFGWVIPTLLIKNGREAYGGSRRTYAVTLDGRLVRVGNGPHVLLKVTVYLSKKNYKRIVPKYVDTIATGSASAHNYRDRLSTRRMRRGWSY